MGVVAEDTDSVLRGGTLYDPGVAPEAEVHAAVASASWHDDTMGFRQVTDVSRLIVTFGSAKQLLEAIECIRETFEVAWTKNGIQTPTCLGYHGRRHVAPGDDNEFGHAWAHTTNQPLE